MESLQDINNLLKSKRLDEALEAANRAIAANPDDALLLYTRGKVLWCMGRQSDAVTDYTASTLIDPDGPASIALEHAQEVLHYFNPDLLNP